MRRVLIVGASGFFGAAIANELSIGGIEALRGSRNGKLDLEVDPESRSSLRETLQAGDIVVDAAGPYQDRSTTLLETAIDMGCDLIDLADSLEYVESVEGLRGAIEAAGIRVLTACSSVSAISAAALHLADIEYPIRLSGFLAPASRFTASAGTARSLLGSVGRPIRTLKNGRIVSKIGWLNTSRTDLNLSAQEFHGHLFETPDPFLLPQVWPSLKVVDFCVDTQVPGLNGMLSFLTGRSRLASAVERFLPFSLGLIRIMGSSFGGLAYEIEGSDGEIAQLTFSADKNSHLIATAPPVLAIMALLENHVPQTGLVPVDRYVDPERLVSYLRARGISYRRSMSQPSTSRESGR